VNCVQFSSILSHLSCRRVIEHYLSKHRTLTMLYITLKLSETNILKMFYFKKEENKNHAWQCMCLWILLFNYFQVDCKTRYRILHPRQLMTTVLLFKMIYLLNFMNRIKGLNGNCNHKKVGCLSIIPPARWIKPGPYSPSKRKEVAILNKLKLLCLILYCHQTVDTP